MYIHTPSKEGFFPLKSTPPRWKKQISKTPFPMKIAMIVCKVMWNPYLLEPHNNVL